MEEDYKEKMDWERTRTQTYFLINVQLPRKNQIPFNKFKKMWPFTWDHYYKGKVVENPEEGVMTADQWYDLIAKSNTIKN
jgi:hypothetical protein